MRIFKHKHIAVIVLRQHYGKTVFGERKHLLLNVKRKPLGPKHAGLLSYGGNIIPCALGRSGVTTLKREGDGATPYGEFRILYGYFRPDRVLYVNTQLPLFPITEVSGWCDEANDPNYNSFVSLPFPKSHEKMMRDDRLYDVCLVLDYNIHPKARNMGSAIFFHLTRPDRGPTEGCVAIDPDHMRNILPLLSERSVMKIHA